MTPRSLRRVACPLLLGLLSSESAAQSSASLFPGPFAQYIADSAIAPAVADLNGDGLLDVVTVGGGSPTVTVTYGRGGFEFGDSQSYSTAPYILEDYPFPYDVAVGDFNEDGKPDLAVANGYKATVGVLLQQPGDTFGMAVQYAVGTPGAEPYSVAIGDLDSDGHLDLVVPCTMSTFVTVLLGVGDGSFTFLANTNVFSSANHAVVDDVDGDGHPDVLITCAGKVSVLRGVGDGHLSGQADYTAGVWPQAFALADVDHDGQRDLVVASYLSDSVSVLRGLTGGTFGPATDYYAGDGPGDLGVVDLDGDGELDVVVLSHGDDWLLSMFVLMGRGGGVLGPPTGYPLGFASWFGAARDLDADGQVDLLLGGFGLSLTILPGLGGGRFETAIYSKLLREADDLAVGEMTGDGVPDLVVVNPGSWSSVSVLRGSGDGSFGAGTAYDVGTYPSAVALGDLDGDTDLDVAVVNATSNNVSVLLNQGGGTLSAAAQYHVVPGARTLAVGDLDGDGWLDLAAAGFWYSFTGGESTEGMISVLLNQGGGVFGPVTSIFPGEYPTALAMADLDADGRLDLLALTADGLAVLLNRGHGQFAAPLVESVNVLGDGAIAVGDLDGDSRLDCALAGEQSGTIEVLFGSGDGHFAHGVSLTVGGVPQSVALGDLDDDGHLDIAAADLYSNSVDVLLGHGAGAFAPSTEHSLLGAEAVAVADMNGDGRLDLATANGHLNNYPFAVSVSLNKRAPLVRR